LVISTAKVRDGEAAVAFTQAARAPGFEFAAIFADS
jgi:hypothetical protein